MFRKVSKDEDGARGDFGSPWGDSLLTKRRHLFAFPAAVLVLAASCVVVYDPSHSSNIPGRSEYRETLNLAGGSIISIDNPSGNIEIAGWEKNEVDIVASGRGGIYEPRRFRFYNARQPAPDVHIDLSDGVLKIRTPQTGGIGEYEETHYVLRVPHSIDLDGIVVGRGRVKIADIYGRIHAVIKEGALSVENYSGSITATIEVGTMDVEVLDVRDEDVIDIALQEGEIILRLEPEASVDIMAETEEGAISSDFHLGVGLPARKVEARIGAGGPAVFLKILRGDIKIVKTAFVPGENDLPLR